MTVPLAVRALRRTPGFTLLALLTIALGVAINSAVFSLVDRVLFRPLPYSDPERLVWIASWNLKRTQYSKSSGWDFDAWRSRTETFAAVEAFWDRPFTLTGTDHPEALIGWQFTPTLFSTLGVTAALGRTFRPEDGEPGRDNVVVMSDALWRRRFHAAPSVIGTTIEMDGRTYTVIGVMPPTFTHPSPGTQLWTPLPLSSALLQDRKQRALRVVARLRDGVSRERAEAELAAIARQHARDLPDTHADWTVSVRPIRDFYIGDVSKLLWIIQGAALMLLVIGCSNIASLVLVRATSRRRETAIRVALGATRFHLLRQNFAEGLTLALAGTAGGVLLAAWGAQILPLLLATRLPMVALLDPGGGPIDSRVLSASVATSLAIGLLFGVMPLLKRQAVLTGSLQTSSRGATGDRRTRLLRSAIVTTQIALSLSLLTGAGLLARSFARLQARSFGFDTDGVVTAQLQLPRDRYQQTTQIAAFLDQLVTGLAALPGVSHAAAVNTLPLTGFNALRPYTRPGQPAQERMAEFRIVTPDYFPAMGIPLRRGRLFDDRDRTGSAEVVIINDTAARVLWSGGDPVGQMVMVGDGLTPSPKVVVGVVGDTRHHDLARDPEPEIYRPAYQAYWPFFGVVVRTATSSQLLARPLRDVAARLDRNVPVSSVQSLGDLAEATWAWRRSSMALVSVFAGAALFLAVLGLYAVMAYSVSQRSREIGVRMALGARPHDIARSVLGQGFAVTGLGVSIGLLVSAVLGGLLQTVLFGIDARDPVTLTSAALLIAACGMAACAPPAVRAARVDPTLALKSE